MGTPLAILRVELDVASAYILGVFWYKAEQKLGIEGLVVASAYILGVFWYSKRHRNAMLAPLGRIRLHSWSLLVPPFGNSLILLGFFPWEARKVSMALV